jgi:signal transduction histidine kinase
MLARVAAVKIVEGPRRLVVALGAIVLIVLVGALDYWTGPDLSFSVFYLLPIMVCAWWLGIVYGYVSAAVGATVWFAIESLGAPSVPLLILEWNAIVRLVFFTIFVAFIAALRRSKLELQAEVLRQTALLRNIAETTSRDQARLARDLHDGIGQYLSGLALRARVLADDLAVDGSPRAADAQRLFEVVQNVARESRRLDHFLGGLRTPDEDLGPALQRLVDKIEELFEVSCLLTIPAEPVPLHPLQADTLFHIAQEALNNALKHARGVGLVVSLDRDSEVLRLRVADQGPGLPRSEAASAGAGLRIMRQRAELIGAALNVTTGEAGRGVVVDCTLPLTAEPSSAV